jgi:hypothetical protein
MVAIISPLTWLGKRVFGIAIEEVTCAKRDFRGGEARSRQPLEYIELVASFVNRSNFLKSREKTDTCEVSSYGEHGLKNIAIMRMPALCSATESHVFF